MQLRTTTTLGEAAGIAALCFGWFIVGSMYAVSAGFKSGTYSESNTLGLVVLEVLLAVTALFILRSRGFDVPSLYPQPTVKGTAGGAMLYLLAAGAAWVATLPFDWNYYAEPLQRLMDGNPIGLPVLVLLGVVNGAYEEVFLLGFLLRGLRGYGLAMAIGLSLLVRVLYHLYQGPLGAIYVGTFGLALSLSYVVTGRLYPAVIAHAMADIVPFL